MSASQSALRRPRRLVLADVLPGDRVRDAVLVAGFAAFTGLAAQVMAETPDRFGRNWQSGPAH